MLQGKTQGISAGEDDVDVGNGRKNCTIGLVTFKGSHHRGPLVVSDPTGPLV